jgi:integrase
MSVDRSEFIRPVDTGLKANKEYNRFYISFKQDNKIKQKVLDFSKKSWDKRTRINQAKKALQNLKEETSMLLDSDAKLDDIVNMYFQTLPDTPYKKNRSSYYNRKVKSKIGKKRAKDILPMHIQNLVNSLAKQGGNPRTAKQVVEVLSPAFKIARANRIVLTNPCEDVKIAPAKRRKMVVNATDKLKIIYDAIMFTYENNPFYRAFFLLALQGRRKGEILNLRWEHISFEHDYYILIDTKNNEEQKIYLPPNVKECLLEFKAKRGWVFESPINRGQRLGDIKRQTSKLKKNIGNWFGMHYCRNVMVSAMAERGVDAIHMSGALGHSDPHTITKYLTMNYLQGSKIASDMIQK